MATPYTGSIFQIKGNPQGFFFFFYKEEEEEEKSISDLEPFTIATSSCNSLVVVARLSPQRLFLSLSLSL